MAAKKKKNPNNFLNIEHSEDGPTSAVMAVFEPEKKNSIVASSAISRTRGEVVGDSICNQYPNLNNFETPFNSLCGNRYTDCREAIRFSLKAYWAYALARNVIEAMVDLANRPLYLKKGNKKTREFVEAWWKKIGIWQFKEQWLREWFRSGNDFVRRYDGKFTEEDRRALQRVYGSLSDGELELPLRYEILNPERITCSNNLSSGNPLYYQEVNSYQVQRMVNPQSEEDREFVKNLSSEDQTALKDMKNGGYLKIDPNKLSVALYKAQPYEPMGVPLLFGALKDIETKLEMKRIDLSVARKAEKAILHVKVGETATATNIGKNFNPNTIRDLQSVLDNDAVLRVLVTDWMVNADWLIPDTNKLLGAAKYEQIDKDIGQALNSIIFDSGEKFANTSIKVTIFLERLKEAGNAFINLFLQPEIKRVCKAINAKSIPEAYFEEISLKDEIQYMKLGVNLAQLGLFTPEELWDWMEKGQIPTKESSEESQKEYQTLRDAGSYLPLVGGSATLQKEQVKISEKQLTLDQEALNAPGRPKGSTGIPQSTKRVSPVGASTGVGYTKLLSNIEKTNKLIAKAKKQFEKTGGKFTKDHETSVKYSLEALMANEKESDWNKKFDQYLVEKPEVNLEALKQLHKIQADLGVDSYWASLFRISTVEVNE